MSLSARSTARRYTLSLHDALPISSWAKAASWGLVIITPSSASSTLARTSSGSSTPEDVLAKVDEALDRSEEHTSELQSLRHLVCRLLLEKKKQYIDTFKYRTVYSK